MRAISSITSKGQITLPLEVRKRLGVGAGDKVEFTFDEGKTVVRPIRGKENPFVEWMGVAKNVSPDFNVDEWVSEMRDDEDRRDFLKELRVANSR